MVPVGEETDGFRLVGEIIKPEDAVWSLRQLQKPEKDADDRHQDDDDTQ